MIIHIVGSLKEEKDIHILRKIVELAYEEGCVLAADWIEPAIAAYQTNNQWQYSLDDEIESIKQADVIIIEATHYNFNQGFQTSAALEQKKPVLVVSRESLKGKVLSWITSDFLIKKEYADITELEKSVNNFIRQNRISTKDLRFNFFIDRSIHNFLEEVAQETGKNKSEIIRDAIIRGIEEDRK